MQIKIIYNHFEVTDTLISPGHFVYMYACKEATSKLDISVATSGRLLERLCEEGILSNLDSRKRKKVFIYKRYIDVFNKD